MVLRFQFSVVQRIIVALTQIGYAERRAGEERQPVKPLTILSLRFLWDSWLSQQTRSELE